MIKRGVQEGIIVFLFIFLNISLVFAEKIDINVGNNYIPGENIDFKINLYNDEGVLINDLVNFSILDYYGNIINKGIINSGEKVNFKLPENSVMGFWKITADYNSFNGEAWFNVLELKKVEIELEGSELIVKNIGNVEYTNPLSISIGDHHETAIVRLAVGQSKRIHLTAPSGEYDIKVSDGIEENTKIFSGVSLTGNVISLESTESFWKQNPIISLFFVVIVLVVLIIAGLKFYNHIFK